MKHAKCKKCGTEDQTKFYPQRKYICKACYIEQVKEHREAEKEASDEMPSASSLAKLKETVKILLDQMDRVTQVVALQEQKIQALYLAKADKSEIDALWASLEKESDSDSEPESKSYAPPVPVYNFPVIPEIPAPNLPPLPDLPKVPVSAVDRDYDKLDNLEWLYINAETLSKQQLSDIRLKWQGVKTTPLVGKDQLVKIMREWAERRYNRIEEEMRKSALLGA